MPFLSLIRALLCCFLLFSPLSLAQEGDRKGHNVITGIVPEHLIPPSPVLPVEEALKTFQTAPGYVIEVVASEPFVEMPVTLKFDGNGRMWICEMIGYMPDVNGTGESDPQGRIVVLEDTDDDGQVDKRTVFLDKVLLPRALYLTDDGLLFSDHQSLQFIKRDGITPIGSPEIVDPGYAAVGNVEHKANELILGLDNWIYSAKSNRRYRRVNGQWILARTAYRGQWGIARDNYGRLYHNHNSLLLYGEPLLPNTLHSNPGAEMDFIFADRLGSNRVWPIRVTPGVNRGYISTSNGYDQNRLDPKTFKLINTTSACGPEVYRGDNFPAQDQALAFVCDTSANLVKAISISESQDHLSGSHPYGNREFLASTDERFRPVNLYTAPDGCLYLLDFYHGIVQHKTFLTTYLRNYILSRNMDQPSRGHGRIYRIRYQKEPRGPAPRLEQASTEELIAHLSHSNGWWRDTAQSLLVQRGSPALTPQLESILHNTSSDHLARLHALWVLEGLGTLKTTHLTPLLDKNTHPQILASALTAALSLPQTELKELEPAIINLEIQGLTIAYRNHALVTIGSKTAMKEAVQTLQNDSPSRFLAEATISGLQGREDAFIAENQGGYQDNDFDAWLKISQRATKEGPDRKRRPRLRGSHRDAFQEGRKLYLTSAACFGCHGQDGRGVQNSGPPLNKSEWVTGPEERLVKILLHGMHGPLKVADIQYNPAASMPGLAINPTIDDKGIAAIATYIRHEWDNRAPQIRPETVAAIRNETKDRKAPYTEAEIRGKN